MSVSKTFRFTLDDELVEKMKLFSQIHKHDDKETFNESWEQWISEEKSLIDSETSRLEKEGYTGDMIRKLYKSVRYYYCKKSNKKEEPKKRRAYITINKEILLAMDRHIHNSYNIEDFTPASAYDQFNIMYDTLIMEEIKHIQSMHEIQKSDIMEKFKKTYKNRYFIYRKNI